MSTFSEDLDFFDATVFDPLAPIPKDSPTSSEFKKDIEETYTRKNKAKVESGRHSTLDESDDERVPEDDNFDDVEVHAKGKEIEKDCTTDEEKGREELDDNFLRKKTSDEKDIISETRFSTELWSGSDSIISESIDSWDLPIGTIPWDDRDKPIVQLLNYADLNLTPEEESGLLTDRIVAACSSYLTESPGNKCHVVAKATLSNKNLNDIRILGYHQFLQYVDLSWNNLKDLTPLGCISYLMYLDVSHNLLEDVLRFQPPLNLTYVNYSYNEVWQLCDLSNFWTLCYLNLSHNKISKIQGLHNLRYLRYLDLSYNKIERFENLSNLRITDLNVEYNLISKFEMGDGLGLNTMPYLSYLHLNNNLVTSLAFLKNVYHLKKLELQGNNISDLVELTEMKHLKNLRYLNMSGNPVSNQKPYRSLLIGLLPELKVLDDMEVDISERVATSKNQSLEVQLEAARKSIQMILLEQFNDTTLGLDVIPVDQGSYPFVILVGPSASSKKQIISCLAEKHPEKIYLGKLHTTRKVLVQENHLLEHTSQEHFQEMTQSGKFLCVSENLGHYYGFSRDELGKAIKEHKLCVTSMDMVSALTVHSYGIRPFLVLAILESKEEHMKRLKMTYGPIVSVLGAAYMAQRQLINTHESNVKRVQIILEDAIREAIKKAMKGDTNECEECLKEANAISSSSCHSERKNPETLSDAENSSDDVVYFDSSRKCYPCTPSQCGFQTCKNTAPESSCETNEEYLRTDTMMDENQIQGEPSTTSYSSDNNSLCKLKFSFVDEYSYGEQDPFSDWSMPFIEWEEINLSDCQLEEAAEILCSKYIENVMSTRDVYQNLHLDNPGLFSLCVYTDVVSKAVKTLEEFLKKVWESTPLRKPTFDMEDDLVYQAFVPKKLDHLKEILRNDFLSSGDAGDSEIDSGRDQSLAPPSVCREMRLKGYGDSFDGLP